MYLRTLEKIMPKFFLQENVHEEKLEDDPTIYSKVEWYLTRKVEDVKFGYL